MSDILHYLKLAAVLPLIYGCLWLSARAYDGLAAATASWGRSPAEQAVAEEVALTNIVRFGTRTRCRCCGSQDRRHPSRHARLCS